MMSREPAAGVAADELAPRPLTMPADVPIDLSRLRREYRQRALSEDDVDADPIRQFLRWLEQAITAGAIEPNAMTLATAAPDGTPSARVVLLKGVNADGFTFFTNYQSRKGRELQANPKAALLFYWPELERQVRVEGDVETVTDEESDEYFASRPLEAQLGSAASPQSQPIASRQELEERLNRLRQQHPDGAIPRPSHWGGFRVKPTRLEFWQGRPSRLHDRIEYRCDAGGWTRRRLAP